MVTVVLRRVAFLGLTVVLTSLLVFLITQALPGDVARVILGREAGEAALEALRRDLGLDEPLPLQYTRWLGRFLAGDWGTSFSTRQEVRPLVLGRLRNSLMLAAVTLGIAIPLALTLGVVAGLRRDSLLDHVISIASLSVVGLPEFVTGLVLIQVLAFGLGLLPANASIRPEAPFVEALPMLILPALTATLVLVAYVARLTRSGVAEEMGRPYVRTAIIKGMPYRRVVWRHVLRNALMPAVTVIAISFGWLISGLVVVENVFNYPGLGRLLVFAIERHDLPVIQAVAMVTVLAYALANLAADLAHAALDPRVRTGR